MYLQDALLARTLLMGSFYARQHLQIAGSTVSLLNPPSFEQIITDSHVGKYNQALEIVNNIGSKLGARSVARHTHMKQCIHRLSALWQPFDRRLIISGVRIKNGTEVRGRVEVNESLHDYLSRVFALHLVNQKFADK